MQYPILALLFTFLCLFADISPTLAQPVKTQVEAVKLNLEQEKFKSIPLEVFKQAESVEQEVLKKVKLSAGSGQIYFGKLKSLSFFTKGMKDRVAGMDCQRYEFRKLNLQMSSVSEVCSVKNKNEFAYLEFPQAGHLKITFLTTSLSNLIGLAASVAQPRSSCEIVYKEKELLSIDCAHIAYSKNFNEVLVLNKFYYNKTSPVTIHASGKWLKDLLAEKSIEMEVPKIGTIKITETVLRQDPPPKVVEAKPVPKPAPAKTPMPSPHENPNLDPRELEEANNNSNADPNVPSAIQPPVEDGGVQFGGRQPRQHKIQPQNSQQFRQDILPKLPEPEMIDVGNEAKPQDIKPIEIPRDSDEDASQGQ